MSESFDSLLEEMADVGIDSEFIERIRRSSDNSGARKERDAAIKQAESALAEAKRYREVVAGQRFREFGIKIKPEALRTPDDLDWADEAKSREWFVNSGLIDPPEPDPEPDEGVEGHARVTAAAQGAPARGGVISPDDAAEWDQAKWKRFETSHPVEAEALSRGEVVKGLTF